MKLVIDVPYDQYAKICAGDFDTTGYFKLNLRNTFRNGTLLPKGHGDLIDRKELTKYPPIWVEDKRRTGEDDAVILLSDILKAEVIIKGEQE